MSDEKFNELTVTLLDGRGPGSIIILLRDALRKVVDETGEPGQKALEKFVAQYQKEKEEAARI